MVLCTVRLTNSTPPSSPAAAVSRSSKAMALSTAGSPNTRANTNDSRPATSPAIMPRTSNDLTMVGLLLLMAGEAEQMPAVVDELVQHLARDDRRRALVHADQVEQSQQDHAREQGPRRELAQRDRGRYWCL